MEPRLRAAAEAARGFMPPDEGLALYEAALAAPAGGPLLEIGSYCGKSTIYLGAAAQRRNRLLFAVDHHRGSEENQVGWEHHDPELVDTRLAGSGQPKLDTLPFFRRTIHDAGLESSVIAVVADSAALAAQWATPLALLFIDGGHGYDPAHRDYQGWSPKLQPGGLLLIHDVFPDPADGGRPPYEIYRRALDQGNFRERRAVGSLRILERTSPHG